MKSNHVKILLNDLQRLHVETTLTFSEQDAIILSKINSGMITNNKTFYEVRNNLWIGYTEEMLKMVYSIIENLSKSLVKVKEHKIKAEEVRQNLLSSKTKSYNQNELKNIEKSYKDVLSLMNSLIVSEDDLKNDAWMNFLKNAFLPFALAVSGGYGWIIYKYYNDTSFFNVIIIWVILMILLYAILTKTSKRYSKSDEDET